MKSDSNHYVMESAESENNRSNEKRVKVGNESLRNPNVSQVGSNKMFDQSWFIANHFFATCRFWLKSDCPRRPKNVLSNCFGTS